MTAPGKGREAMEFRKAVPSDLPAVMPVYRAAIRHMDEAGIHQWDEIYPSEADIKEDIERGEMRLGLIGGAIASAFTLNSRQDEQYANGKWKYDGGRCAVVHRLCVRPDRQNRGL